MAFSPLNFVRSLSFVRYGGTQAERQAAELILRELACAGGSGELMAFQIPASAYKYHAVKAVVLPADTGMPEEMREELDRHFMRETK